MGVKLKNSFYGNLACLMPKSMLFFVFAIWHQIYQVTIRFRDGRIMYTILRRDTPSTRMDFHDMNYGFILVEGEYFYHTIFRDGHIVYTTLRRDTPSTRINFHDINYGYILVEGEYFYKNVSL